MGFQYFQPDAATRTAESSVFPTPVSVPVMNKSTLTPARPRPRELQQVREQRNPCRLSRVSHSAISVFVTYLQAQSEAGWRARRIPPPTARLRIQARYRSIQERAG